MILNPVSGCLRAWNELEQANFENPVYSFIQHWKRMLMKFLQRKQVSPFVISNFVIVANGVTGERFGISQFQYKFFYENINRKFSEWFFLIPLGANLCKPFYCWWQHFFINTERLATMHENQLSKIFKVHTGAIGVGVVRIKFSPRGRGNVES